MFKLPHNYAHFTFWQGRAQNPSSWASTVCGQEYPDVQAAFRKGRRTRDQIANILWIIEKAREFQKNIYFCFTDYTKAFDCVDHNKLWKIQEGNTRAPYLLPEKPVCTSRRNGTGHGTMDWFKIGKGVCQGCVLSTCLFNLYAEYIICYIICWARWNTNWNQDINNLR